MKGKGIECENTSIVQENDPQSLGCGVSRGNRKKKTYARDRAKIKGGNGSEKL